MTIELPFRTGPRPRTHRGIPHRQLDQVPAPHVYESLTARFLAIPNTTRGPSLISVPGAQALFLDCAGSPDPIAFLRGYEFAHVHPPSDGSLHVVLSTEDRDHTLERGWGELHPLAGSAGVPPTLLMVYAPRTEGEVETVLSIAMASKEHARRHCCA